MNVPQFGIFAQGTNAHQFIEFDLRPDIDMPLATSALSRLRAPAVASGGVNLVIGFGCDLWREVAPEDAPSELAPFQRIGTGAAITLLRPNMTFGCGQRILPACRL